MAAVTILMVSMMGAIAAAMLFVIGVGFWDAVVAYLVTGALVTVFLTVANLLVPEEPPAARVGG